MAHGLNETPSANRIHIGVFGKRNSGKSTLVNTLTGQRVSIVSDVLGTTTDPVYKAIEIFPLGPCVVIDTAGIDDDIGELGKSRVQKTKLAAEKSDLAIIIFSGEDISYELSFYAALKKNKAQCLAVINTFGKPNSFLDYAAKIKNETGLEPLIIDAANKSTQEILRGALAKALPENYGEYDITRSLAKENDVVMLVMPQDIQAPRGRLILPQVQTIRELLDKKCLTICSTINKAPQALAALKAPPKLIITDSQVFSAIYAIKPKESLLTSFSVLFAALKGDIAYFAQGAAAIESLNESSRVLIAECCTHAPLEEDIGRVKLPRMLKKRFGEGITIDFVSGTDFFADKGYSLIIQCGACMFNKKYVLTRVEKAKNAGVPMTNYGIAMAYLTGILDKIAMP